MDSTIHFTKMHGIGNDYIYIDCLKSTPGNLDHLSRVMSKRHTAVGSDGIILILPSEIADFRMRIFNADGSEAKMCGNGSRCVGKYVYDHALTDKTQLTLETNSGVKHLNLNVDPISGKVTEVTVDMGPASTDPASIGMNHHGSDFIEQPIESLGHSYFMTAISMGNPHGVIFVDAVDNLPITEIGPALENHKIWSDRANIEFIETIDRHTIKMRVWERGSGETMACGTGACAAATAAIITGRAEAPVTVKLLGGDLVIDYNPLGHVMMTGGATEVFTGDFPLPSAPPQSPTSL